MILKDKYINYENAKVILNLDSLEERRHILCLIFAKNGIKHNNLNDLFPENDKIHKMKTRAVEKCAPLPPTEKRRLCAAISFGQRIQCQKCKSFGHDCLIFFITMVNDKFAKNGIKHNNLNDLFPENDKIHKMKTREVEKYKV